MATFIFRMRLDLHIYYYTFNVTAYVMMVKLYLSLRTILLHSTSVGYL